MNNQIPYMDNLYMKTDFNQNNLFLTIDRLQNRINRLERQVKILENRINRLTTTNPKFLNNEFDDDNNMYVI